MPEENVSVPKHVAIIMDGNGRWAKKRHLPRVMGHHEGVRAVERTVRAARDAGIAHLSLYAFSTENWKRSPSEVGGLMGLFRYYVSSKIDALKAEGARIRFAGNLAALPEDIRQLLRKAEGETASCTAIDMVVCLNYRGRQEILEAINAFLEDRSRNTLSDSERPYLTEELLRRYFYLSDLPDPDLIIRTSGELRMSNFWLWQGAYSELYFCDTFWPDFGEEELEKALRSYAERERRYGGA